MTSVEGPDDITIVEWDANRFHERVAYWERLGYKALRETYEIKAEIHPETGRVLHQYSIILVKGEPAGAVLDTE